MKTTVPMTLHETVTMKDRNAWRLWLMENHTIKKEIWLVYYKKHTKHVSVSYPEAVEEAICFGWIDGQVKTIDSDRYMQRYTPRNAKSPWSEINRERAERMIHEGLMTEAGLKIYEEGMKNNLIVPSSKNFSVPDFLEDAFRKNDTVWNNFQEMAPSARLLYVHWVTSAKTLKTRMKRINKSVELIAQNRKLNETIGR
jgi:uncharacterized protein YdeI (YjbR/CyaY-like superfamily)